jgi:hypothetical protein
MGNEMNGFSCNFDDIGCNLPHHLTHQVSVCDIYLEMGIGSTGATDV